VRKLLNPPWSPFGKGGNDTPLLINVSAIILSAGESRRMGTLKPLLPFGEKTVIETVLDNFLKVNLYEIIVVLGYQANRIIEIISRYSVKIVFNEKYKDGMLSSIQKGIEATDEKTEAYMIALVDQPFISSSLIESLLGKCENNGIVIPSYNGRRGHPIIIPAKYRDEIFRLDANIGLRQLIQNHEDEIIYVDVSSDDVIRDMDFPEDYKREIELVLKRE
jgi:molybdenum cofactor cytidylyltransferase